MGYLAEHILNSDITKSRLPKTHFAVAQSFWNVVQSTIVILPWPMQDFKTIAYFSMLWENVILRDMSLRSVSDGYHILHTHPGWSRKTTRSRLGSIQCKDVLLVLECLQMRLIFTMTFSIRLNRYCYFTNLFQWYTRQRYHIMGEIFALN